MTQHSLIGHIKPRNKLTGICASATVYLPSVMYFNFRYSMEKSGMKLLQWEYVGVATAVSSLKAKSGLSVGIMVDFYNQLNNIGNLESS